MVRQVYGKKPARAAFTVSNIFTESSPSKTDSRPTTRDENSDVEVTKALEGLKIQDKGNNQPARRRRALSTRDGNSRQAGRKSKPVPKKEIKKAKDEEESSPDDEIIPPKCNIQPKKTIKRTQLPSPPPTEPSELLCDPYIAPLVSLTNDQKAPLEFSTWSEALTPHFAISKIAEASYSEVYRLSLLTAHPTLNSTDESVLKLLALKPPPSNVKKTKAQERKEEDMSSVEDVVSEIRLLKRMTEIPGFTNYRALHVLKGRPCKSFIKAWKDWNKGRAKGEKSTFPDPGRKGGYGDDQYWAVVEMQDAGTDVEKCVKDEQKLVVEEEEEADTNMRSIWATWDVFWQVVLAVAKGEAEAQFEHRDLHLGNICVRRKDGNDDIILMKDFGERNLHFTNLETTIIDYTLSRADMSITKGSGSLHSSFSNLTLSSTISEVESDIAYNPLQNQPKIFEGDAEEDYQYEIYRHMRTLVLDSPPCPLKNVLTPPPPEQPWKQHKPITNILWLHFVLYKLCESAQWPSQLPGPQLKDIDQNAPMTRREKALELEYVLREVVKILEIERIFGDGEIIESAVELVGYAVQNAWLGEGDIIS